MKFHRVLLLSVFLLLLMIFKIKAQQKIEIIKLENLFDKIQKSNDTVYIANFWATWCSPCVKELPDFEQLNAVYKSKKMKLLLVSIDFKSDIGKVRNFANKKMLQSTIVLLDEPKYNDWIDKIDMSWEGQIPATVFYKNREKVHFLSEQIDFQYLEALLKPLLK